MREIYFDNAATTRVRPEVSALMQRIMEEDYGNPSARYKKGMEAENLVKEAAARIASTLKVKPNEIVFTSGGTESDNMALVGTALARARRGKHIVSCNIEHAAVYKTMEFLQTLGYEISFVGVDEKGRVKLDELEKAIRPDTILVSIMAVNNEIGSVEPVGEIGRLIKEKNPECYFHTDAIQAYGKLILRPAADRVDLLTMSSHKIHGPKGCGFIYIRDKVHVTPIIYGGGQQHDMRSGTENVPGIAGMGLACEMYYKEHAAIEEKMLAVKGRLYERLNAMEGVKCNSGMGSDFAPHILSASFAGVRAEVLLHALEDKGIYVSSGSACSSNHPAVSGTLRAIGLEKALLDSTLRFSFGIYNEPEEADVCADALQELLPVLRKYQRH